MKFAIVYEKSANKSGIENQLRDYDIALVSQNVGAERQSQLKEKLGDKFRVLWPARLYGAKHTVASVAKVFGIPESQVQLKYL